MPMLPPQCGIGFDSNTSSDFSRKSRIQRGSRFISDISDTICALRPRRALNTPCVCVTKSYLFISPRASSSGAVIKSVAMVDPIYSPQRHDEHDERGANELILFVVSVMSLWFVSKFDYSVVMPRPPPLSF